MFYVVTRPFFEALVDKIVRFLARDPDTDSLAPLFEAWAMYRLNTTGNRMLALANDLRRDVGLDALSVQHSDGTEGLVEYSQVPFTPAPLENEETEAQAAKSRKPSPAPKIGESKKPVPPRQRGRIERTRFNSSLESLLEESSEP